MHVLIRAHGYDGVVHSGWLCLAAREQGVKAFQILWTTRAARARTIASTATSNATSNARLSKWYRALLFLSPDFFLSRSQPSSQLQLLFVILILTLCPAHSIPRSVKTLQRACKATYIVWLRFVQSLLVRLLRESYNERTLSTSCGHHTRIYHARVPLTFGLHAVTTFAFFCSPSFCFVLFCL